MPHIALDPHHLGIRSLFAYKPETGAALRNLAQTLLRGASPLSEADRELIAAFVSHGNKCRFCTESHAATARALLGAKHEVMDQVLADPDTADIPIKLRALLKIAGEVRVLGSAVKEASVERAKAAGATDGEVHDTVLIAAAFCMYNRYVDGLATEHKAPAEAYAEMGRQLAKHGYK